MKILKKYKRTAGYVTVFATVTCCAMSTVQGAGLLKPKGSGHAGIHIKSHHVDVTLNNGFARTEIDQLFANDTDRDIEAIYSLPLPEQASLSELSLWIDGVEIIGEVSPKEKARKIYEEQVAQGNDTALAEKNDFKSFDINVGRVPAHADTRVRLVYYQPLKMDLNVGRYLYPLAEGGVDEERIAFWEVDDRVTGDFSFHLTLKSAFPVKDIRLPGYDRQAQIEQVQAQGKEQNSHTYQVTLTSEGITSLSQDIIFYYRLDDSVPARIELIPYREHPNAQGTFMVVVTPAADLHPIREGTDWIFVLDTSGSMSGGKIHTLCEGMTRVLGKMSAQDRFRIITFNNQACDLTRGYVGATPDNVRHWIEQVKSIQAGGGTALFAGLEKAYHDLDDDRTTGVILVTDGVCNVGPTQHGDFIRLLRKYDLRLFTFVVGNSANQPLMTRLALESGGFAMNIADADDIIGRLIQAKTRVLHECMHDVEIRFKGENVHDLTPSRLGSLYIGQQAVVLGRYNGSGEVHLEMNAKISGQEKTWYCSALLPEVDQANPELERIWALSRIDEKMQEIRAQGETPDRRKFIEDMGIEFSLVTDYTSMLVVREDVFEKHDVERRNTQRVQRERQAQQLQAKASADNYRIDNGGTFNNRSAPGIGTGPVGPLFLILLGGIRHLKNRKNNA